MRVGGGPGWAVGACKGAGGSLHRGEAGRCMRQVRRYACGRQQEEEGVPTQGKVIKTKCAYSLITAESHLEIILWK